MNNINAFKTPRIAERAARVGMSTALAATGLFGGVGLAIGTAGPAAATPFVSCALSTPNNTILFYNKETGAAATGMLTDGQWTQRDSVTGVPTGFTNAAASRDTLVLYNEKTGAIRTGTFKDGVYANKESGAGATGWTHVEASGDSVLFYNAKTGHAATGTLTNGVYREMQSYDNFAVGWSSIASSCNTIAFVRNVGHGDLPNYVIGYGTLANGIYTHKGDAEGVLPTSDLIATKDSLLLRQGLASGDSYQLATLSNGNLGAAQANGTSGHWNLVGRTATSLFFYKDDGTAWTSTLNAGNYANVGPIADVSSGWTIIEGGV